MSLVSVLICGVEVPTFPGPYDLTPANSTHNSYPMVLSLPT